MQTPEKLTTPAKSVSNASINAGNIGAMERGPKACAKVVIVGTAMADTFQTGLQFSSPRQLWRPIVQYGAHSPMDHVDLWKAEEQAHDAFCPRT
jgi:hypothetical protein